MLVDRGFDEPKEDLTETSEQSIYDELGELTKYVEMMTRTIAEMEVPVASTSDQLPDATAHLGELAKITEEGTHKVMALTEEMTHSHGQMKKLLRELSGQPEWEQKVQDIIKLIDEDEARITNITVSLGFQDIVAQRVAKLMTVLDEVQHKLLKLVVVFGLQNKKDKTKKEGRGYEMLQQLEASKSTALKQDLVDDILSEFGFN
ncbi:MAG: protein phosphatase CheZ [Nitrospirales bacterium]|nr:protein phosphatase CheZ [Nitrospira sp.]MDR4502321.1 protein phosphatase CheZ [Nitrospirales bacterium]